MPPNMAKIEKADIFAIESAFVLQKRYPKLVAAIRIPIIREKGVQEIEKRFKNNITAAMARFEIRQKQSAEPREAPAERWYVRLSKNCMLNRAEAHKINR